MFKILVVQHLAEMYVSAEWISVSWEIYSTDAHF